MLKLSVRTVMVLVALIVLSGCGDDDSADVTPASEGNGAAETDTDSGDADTDADADGATEDAGSADDGSADDGDGATGEAAPTGATGGTLVLGDETIVLDSARCFLEEQDAAAGGGKILFVAQGFGTTAAGEPLVLDVSRYDEDSQFTGDDVIVDIGELGASTSWTVRADLGTVRLDGRSLSADGLSFVSSVDLAEVPGSFALSC